MANWQLAHSIGRVLAALGAAILVPTVLLADDVVNRKIQADAAFQMFGATGKGVAVAILDRGIDWQHPDFIKADGTTRIKWLLDMSSQQGCGSNGKGTPSPTEYTAAQINAALAGGALINSRDAVGHGTATAGLAAGNGRAFASGKYGGVAPEADLIIVKMVSEGAPAHDSQPAESPFQGCIQEALTWLDGKISALGEPVVALINSGTQWGPVDGTSVVSRQIDSVFGLNRPGRVYVAAGGDEGSLPNHAGGTYDASGTVVRFSKSATDTAYMTGWYTGSLPAEITVTFDDGTSIGPVSPTGSATLNGISIFQYPPGQAFYPWTSTSGDRAIWIMISGHKAAGSITIRGLQSSSGKFDLYGDVSGPNLTPIDSFLDHLVPGRLADYASTRSAVVSGDYVARTTWVDIDGHTQAITNEGAVDDIWLKSSGGPTRDGRSPGVDCAAPGQNSFAASAQNSYWHTLRFNLIQDGGGWYVRAGGTSGSAPITVGAVALMLQLSPTLTGSQVKQLLQRTSSTDSFTASVPSPNWGYGKLNLLHALSSAASPQGPALTDGSLTNGATYLAGGLVPGSWAQVKGTGLSKSTRIWADSDFVGLGNSLPISLDGIEVKVNNQSAAVYYISSNQISFQVPAGVTGNVSVQVINNGRASNSVNAASTDNSPGIFPVILNGINYPAGVFLDGRIVGDPANGSSFRKAKPGEVMQLYATGLVPTPAGVLPVPQSITGVTVTVGDITVPADSTTLVAVGEFQINFTVPQLGTGTYPISIQVAGVSSPNTINSEPPGPVILPIQP